SGAISRIGKGGGVGFTKAVAGIAQDTAENLLRHFFIHSRAWALATNSFPNSSISFWEREWLITRRIRSASPGVKPAMAVAISMTCSWKRITPRVFLRMGSNWG